MPASDSARIPCVLTIAGSDSGGGAGIQADLKTFAALGVHGMTAITAVTAQNSSHVGAIHEVPAAVVTDQIAMAAGNGVDAAKTGMLFSAAIVEAVAAAVAACKIVNLVVDPVLVSSSGTPLLKEDAVRLLLDRLFPRALLVTPNLPEAGILTGKTIGGPSDIEEALRVLHGIGAANVLIKGGHASGPEAVDYLFDGVEIHTFAAPRVAGRDPRGTGCTLSAAIAAYLAKGLDVPEAVRQAKDYLTSAIRASFDVGQSRPMLDHFWRKN